METNVFCCFQKRNRVFVNFYSVGIVTHRLAPSCRMYVDTKQVGFVILRLFDFRDF
jgi:hypothetical protein